MAGWPWPPGRRGRTYEYLQEKDFFAAHASQQDQFDLNGSVLLAIFSQCGGFFLRGGDTTVVSLLLMAGTCACCLGIRYAQSRAWAVLLLLLGCGNFLLGAPATGSVLGGVLLGAGVWSVAGTVRFHRRYQRFLAEGAEKEKPGQDVK